MQAQGQTLQMFASPQQFYSELITGLNRQTLRTLILFSSGRVLHSVSGSYGSGDAEPAEPIIQTRPYDVFTLTSCECEARASERIDIAAGAVS
jgi:hypothetical protein